MLPPGVRRRYKVPVGQTISPLLILLHHRQVKMSPIIQNPAPAFTVSAFIDGAFKEVSLSDYISQWYSKLLFFFFSWLPPYCFLTMFNFRVILMFYAVNLTFSFRSSPFTTSPQ